MREDINFQSTYILWLDQYQNTSGPGGGVGVKVWSVTRSISGDELLFYMNGPAARIANEAHHMDQEMYRASGFVSPDRTWSMMESPRETVLI
jgi:hypothetical protein